MGNAATEHTRHLSGAFRQSQCVGQAFKAECRVDDRSHPTKGAKGQHRFMLLAIADDDPDEAIANLFAPTRIAFQASDGRDHPIFRNCARATLDLRLADHQRRYPRLYRPEPREQPPASRAWYDN